MTEDTDDRGRVLRHLRDGVSRGKTYFKSRSIADETDLSSKQVGVHLSNLREACDDLEIEKWARSTSTTRHVSEA